MSYEAVRIRLSEERRAKLIEAIQRYFDENLDQQLGGLGAGLLLDFFINQLGAPVYNQAIADAHAYMQEKLVDLSGEFYEPEPDR